MPRRSMGLPDPKAYGTLKRLKPGAIVPYFAQLHQALKAGPHYDVRLGEKGKGGGLLSWAVRKGIPEPGVKHLALRQPLHAAAYGAWEGTIPKGKYGAGYVKSKIQGKALITRVDDNGITFVTAHERYPQRFRLQKTKDDRWLLINVTPTTKREYKKVHFTQVPEEDIQRILTPENMIQAKVDGSAEFVEILRDKIESLSYRPSKVTDRPIVHTERVGRPKPLTGEYADTVLRGELYGVRKGKTIPAAELGGLLNATIALSLSRQKEKGIKLKHQLYDIKRLKGKDVAELPYSERYKLLQEVAKKLPEEFQVAKGYTDPAAQLALWHRIKAGKHPLTREGIVAHPLAGGRPSKVKTYPEADVYIRGFFPGRGKWEGRGVGGFYYSTEPQGKILGKVGTGYSDEDRVDMWDNPGQWIGRKTRIRAQEQFPSGAYRAPSFIALHEG